MYLTMKIAKLFKQDKDNKMLPKDVLAKLERKEKHRFQKIVTLGTYKVPINY